MDSLADDVIHQLRTTQPPPTLNLLAAGLGIGRDRLQQIIGELTDLGYRIATDEKQRLRVTSSPDRMIEMEIRNGLATRTFGRTLHCYHEIGSTNATAIDLAESGAPEGTVVVAEKQTRGRGRLGRGWESPTGLGIWSTVILRPPIPLDRVPGLSLVAALAFADTVDSELGLDVQLKWPNDGFIHGRKVCGILVEMAAETDGVHYAVCGTGINVNHEESDFPAELRTRATSLAMAAGHVVDRLRFYRAFLLEFEILYNTFVREGLAPLLPIYRARSLLLGHEVTVAQGAATLTGMAEEIDDCGRLILRTKEGPKVINSGEATLRTQT